MSIRMTLWGCPTTDPRSSHEDRGIEMGFVGELGGVIKARGVPIVVSLLLLLLYPRQQAL